MDRLNFLSKAYGTFHNRPGVPYWVLKPFRMFFAFCASSCLPAYLAKKRRPANQSRSSVIVSFTSIPERIDNVWQVVECMLRQSVLPSKILLYLSQDQFPTPESIPQSLKQMEGGIFEIKIVPGDIKSHKKYYYVSREYPDSLVLLIDDDIYYPSDMIEKSLKLRELHPDAVVANYARRILRNADGSLKPYGLWPVVGCACKDPDLFPGSGGGTLLRPSELYKDLCDIDLATSLTPSSDDIFLNAMIRLSKKPIVKTGNKSVLPIHNRQDVELATRNLKLGGNDDQLRAVEEHYGHIFSAN